ncbi:MAG: uroporphyrinogen decarboxylase family protein, partial [Microcoleaceae cyanobacterium]
MPQSGCDFVSVDWTVDMADARQRLGENIGVQGNIDPCVLFGPKELIKTRIAETIQKAGKRGHILNLGHGVLQHTPEENVRYFFEMAKQADKL